MKKAFFLFAGLALAGCEVSVPVTGMIGPDPAQGQATAKASGTGTFWVATIEGLNCQGTYDSLSSAPTLYADVICNDGRTGKLLITRTLDMVSGTVVGKLSDGTKGQFVFGNLTFDQAFGGGSARIKS